MNQLASSDKNLDKREEWFTCACCPPNVTRTLGFLGGYLWTFKEDASKSSPTADIHVHLYGSAKLIFDVGEHSVSLKQESDWPWEGEVKFQLEGAEVVDTNISLRIPGWAQGWKVSEASEQVQPSRADFGSAESWTSRRYDRERLSSFASGMAA